jgi:hypothetical protein
MRIAGEGSCVGFFCELHRQPGDVPIAPPFIFRRVAVTLEVLFAGTSSNATLAQIEAVSRLEQAVQAAGGVINLHSARSTVGRYVAPASPPRKPAGKGRG